MATIHSILERGRRAIYRGPVRTLMHKTGAHRYARRVYYPLIQAIEERTAVSERTVTLKTERGEATLQITTNREVDEFAGSETPPEADVIDDLLGELRANDVFYDVGSHVGVFSTFAGNAVDSVEIVALEPHPQTVTRLRENLALNDINGTVIEAGVSDQDGKHGFDLRRDSVAGMGVLEDDGGATIMTRSLDSLIAAGDAAPPTVIKSDIAGEEINMIRGGETAFADHIRLAYIEVHPSNIKDRGATDADLLDQLRDWGFDELSRLDDETSGTYTLKACKTTQ